MADDELEVQLGAKLIAEAASCWQLVRGPGNYMAGDFIRDVELFVGGPVHTDQIKNIWLRVLGTDAIVEGLSEGARTKLDREVDRENWDSLRGWNSLASAWIYAVSSRQRQFLAEDGSNCWLRWTGSSFDVSLWRAALSLYRETKRHVQLRGRYHNPFSEQLCGLWQELFTLPGAGFMYDGGDDE